MATPAQVPAVHAFARTMAGGIAVIVVLFVADTFLAKSERAAARVEAERHYQSGRRLMQSGQSAQAAEQFRSALSVDRANQDYELALGQALRAAGKTGDAQVALSALLEENPFGGAANLALARVMVQEGNITDATGYYHRAIYGQWKEDARRNQLLARFELVDLLRRQDSKEALLAELLPLQDEAPDDAATQKKLGQGFLAAGSPVRAAAVFRAILHRDQQDSQAHAGLGEAEFAGGNYAGAREEFRIALRLRPPDEGTEQNLQSRLELCNRILELDPALRSLGGKERLSRSRKLAELALDRVQPCLGATPLIKSAQSALRSTLSYDQNLDLADQLWRAGQAECKSGLPEGEPLAIVLSKVNPK